MKLSELKTRLKNKYVVRIVAGVLTIALLGSSMTAVAVQADQKKDAAVQTEQKEDSSAILSFAQTNTSGSFEPLWTYSRI